LGVLRSDTENACAAAGLTPWQDPQNLDSAFTRVRLRREVLPLLDEVLGGGTHAALARTAHLMADDLAALDETAAAVLRAAVGADGQLAMTPVASRPSAIRRRVLRAWVARQTGVRSLTFRHLAALEDIVMHGRDGSAVRIEGGIDLVRAGPTLVVAEGDGRLGRMSLKAPGLTTALTAADATAVTAGDDPGAAHGYAGELKAMLIDEHALSDKVAELARAVAADHDDDRPPLIVCVLKGAVMFLTDFVRALPIPAELEFMAVSSYGSATSSSGVVRILKDLDRDISGRRVLIIEDIVDSGLTLSWLRKNLASRQPASIDVVALLRKPAAGKVDVNVGYVGFDIPSEFVVGYGLDYAERYRDLPFVGLLAERMYR
jgi:hypoxanthine phosphoribosyltransferase